MANLRTTSAIATRHRAVVVRGRVRWRRRPAEPRGVIAIMVARGVVLLLVAGI